MGGLVRGQSANAHEQFVLEIEWHTDRPLPRLVGPFDTREKATKWGAINIPNGSWNVAPLAAPFPGPTGEQR